MPCTRAVFVVRLCVVAMHEMKEMGSIRSFSGERRGYRPNLRMMTRSFVDVIRCVVVGRKKRPDTSDDRTGSVELAVVGSVVVVVDCRRSN